MKIVKIPYMINEMDKSKVIKKYNPIIRIFTHESKLFSIINIFSIMFLSYFTLSYINNENIDAFKIIINRKNLIVLVILSSLFLIYIIIYFTYLSKSRNFDGIFIKDRNLVITHMGSYVIFDQNYNLEIRNFNLVLLKIWFLCIIYENKHIKIFMIWFGKNSKYSATKIKIRYISRHIDMKRSSIYYNMSDNINEILKYIRCSA